MEFESTIFFSFLIFLLRSAIQFEDLEGQFLHIFNNIGRESWMQGEGYYSAFAAVSQL